MANILRSRITTVLLLALVAIFGVHLATRVTENVRLDWTADDLYSLSPGTRDILDKMREDGVEPMEATLYFSETSGKTLPKFIKDFIGYERYLRALLREYAIASKGKIEVSYVDPITDSDEAQDALDFGLDGKPINQHGDRFFFGLVLQTRTGSRDVIDFLWPAQQETVEYEITKRIHGLIWPTKKRVAVLSSLEVLSDASNPYMAQILAAQGKQPKESWLAMTLLAETHELSNLAADTDHISRDDYDLLLVIHPKDLGERALWAIDEWVSTGGNALVFVDPYAIGDQAPQDPQQPWMAMQYKPASNLDRLLGAWGIERVEDRFAVDFDLAVSRATSQLGPATRVIYDLAIDDRQLAETVAAGHPIVQGIADLRFLLAGSLRTIGEDESAESDDEGAGITRTPLVTTTSKGNTIEIQPGFGGDGSLTFNDLRDAGRILDAYDEGSEPVVLAYQLQGLLPSAFPDGASLPAATPPPPPGLPPGVQLPPPTDGTVTEKPAVAADARAPATVVVFADVDLLDDQIAFQSSLFGVQAANDNHKLLLNAVDYLLGSEDLMRVRAKKSIRRPFTRFDDIEAAADRETLEREKELRAEIATFEEQLQERTRDLGSQNAALFKKQVQDEVDQLNARILEKNRELRDIRLEKRKALEGEEAKVRRTTLWLTPSLVLAFGLGLFVRRRSRDTQARRGA